MRKRSKYRPKPQYANPLAYVLESVKPLAEHDSYVLDWKLKADAAFGAMLRAQATSKDMDTLVAARNIVEALLVILKGVDVDGTLPRSQCALIEICERANAGKGTATKAPELQAIRDLMMLHDELLDVVTVTQFEKALAYAKKHISAGKARAIKPIPA